MDKAIRQALMYRKMRTKISYHVKTSINFARRYGDYNQKRFHLFIVFRLSVNHSAYIQKTYL